MKESERLLAKIREGQDITNSEKLKLIVSLSIPSILAQMTSTLMFFIDASMVGALGAEASAAVGIVDTTTWLFGSLTGAASMGFGVMVAHAIGANDMAKARRIMRQGLVAALSFSFFILALAVAVHWRLPLWLGGGEDIHYNASMYFLLFSLSIPFFQLVSYSGTMLKCSGNMKVPSMLNIMMCVLDVCFNFLLIYPTRVVCLSPFGSDLSFVCPGAGLGVVGAAIGTSMAITVTAVLMAFFAFFRSSLLRLQLDKVRRWRPQRQNVLAAAKLSAPMALQYCLMNGAQMVATVIVAPLGNFAIAANCFAITVEAVCYMPGYGIADAATTLVGQSIGAKRLDLCRAFAFRAIAMGMLIMALMGGVMYLFAPELMHVLSPVREIIDLGAEALRIEAFAEPMFAAAIICNSIFIGAGDTLIPACMNLGTMWGIRITLAYFLAPLWGLAGVWTGMAVELSMRGFIFLVRFFKGNWMKKGR